MLNNSYTYLSLRISQNDFVTVLFLCHDFNRQLELLILDEKNKALHSHKDHLRQQDLCLESVYNQDDADVLIPSFIVPWSEVRMRQENKRVQWKLMAFSKHYSALLGVVGF